MSKKSENGVRNIVDRFKELINCCGAHGSKYNPGRAAISLPAMEALLALAEEALEDVSATGAAYDGANVRRQGAFAPMRNLMARVVSALQSFEVPAGTIDHARSIARKSGGRRASAPPPAPADDKKEHPIHKKISSAQTGFANQIGHMEQLIDLVRTVEDYTPNETDLKVEGLEEFFARLRNAHNDAGRAGVAYSNAITRREAIFYGDGAGLSPIAQAAKNYMKSVFGPANPAYRQVSKLPFPSRKGVAPLEVETAGA